jgi:hypothetical protein
MRKVPPGAGSLSTYVRSWPPIRPGTRAAAPCRISRCVPDVKSMRVRSESNSVSVRCRSVLTRATCLPAAIAQWRHAGSRHPATSTRTSLPRPVMGLRLGAGLGGDVATGEVASSRVLVGDGPPERSVADGSPARVVLGGEPATGEQASTSEAPIVSASDASRIREASHSRQRNSRATARSRDSTKTTLIDGQCQKVHALATNDETGGQSSWESRRFDARNTPHR